MSARNDNNAPTWTSAKPEAAREDIDALPAGREYALSMCLASAVAKHTFRDKAATRGPQISPARRGKGRVALMPLPVTRCDPLLQESIVKYEHEVRGAGGGKQISPCRHHPV